MLNTMNGHSKAEYFSSGAEGALIVVAAISIAFEAEPLTQFGLGLALSLLATAINGAVAFVLLRAGRRLRSIMLRADAHHLFTDVVTIPKETTAEFTVKEWAGGNVQVLEIKRDDEGNIIE